MVSQIVSEPAGNLGHVVVMREVMIIGLTVGVDVPLARDPLPRFDRLAQEAPARLVALEVILEPLDPGGEVRGVAPGIVAGSLDVALVELVHVVVQTPLHLRAVRALGVVGQELPGLLDQIGERRARQRLGADQVVDELPLHGGPAGRQFVLERAGQGHHLGAAGRVRELAKERVELGERLLRVVDRREGKGLGVDLLPALVVPDQLASLLDLADGGSELRRLLLDPFKAIRSGRGPLRPWRPARRRPSRSTRPS